MRWLSWLRRLPWLRRQRLRWLQSVRRLQSLQGLPLRRRVWRVWRLRRRLDRLAIAGGMHGVLRIVGPLPLVLAVGAP